MTHTLHRRGSVADLQNDFVVIVLAARGYNDQDARPKIIEIFRVMQQNNPISFSLGGVGTALTSNAEKMLADAIARDDKLYPAAHAVFRTQEDLIAFLRSLKEKDLGISVVVSGLFDTVHDCCRRVGLRPHTVNTSLGVFGRTDRLPEEPILEVHTMCGHGLISYNRIRNIVKDIHSGTVTAKDAAKKLGMLCECGLFNCERAEAILTKLAAQ